MTKDRAPLSINQALDRIAGFVPGGVDEMAATCDRQPGTIRAWRDPDRAEDIPLPCGIKLDLLWRRHGGEGRPIHDAYSMQLDLAEAEAFSDSFELARQGAVVMRESGEVAAAIVEASLPGPGRATARRKVLEEGDQAISAIKRAMASAALEPEAPT